MAVTSPIDTTPKTIVLKGNPHHREGVVATGVTTLKPGMRVDFDASGVKLGGAAAAGAFFAVENELAGYGIDDTYAAGDIAHYVVCNAGDEVYAYIASAEVISVGERMEGGANGMLVTLASGEPLAEALEAKDLSGSPAPAAAARIRVRVL